METTAATQPATRPIIVHTAYIIGGTVTSRPDAVPAHFTQDDICKHLDAAYARFEMVDFTYA